MKMNQTAGCVHEVGEEDEDEQPNRIGLDGAREEPHERRLDDHGEHEGREPEGHGNEHTAQRRREAPGASSRPAIVSEATTGGPQSVTVRTLARQRDPERETELNVVVALDRDEPVEPGDLVMLEDLGGCFVLSVRDSPEHAARANAGERAWALRVMTLAYGNTAPDIP